ncbi:hypothetical protein GCM10010174_43320 [Kutzneria viridogrisea]|uniref:DUF6879 domain-containing protein n=1 Tax=Kutzneria viridogrisea TaxID=47990 RepID=A0ABR6BP24_9PSEU|nr:hypothetical protein [Kutzneria viridogrisea]
MRLDGKQWRHIFDSYEHEAFRLETHQVYSVPGEQEELNSFLRTGKLELGPDDPWLVRIRAYRDSGRRVIRVHVVTPPLTDYLRYEFAGYAYSVEAGEEIHILDPADSSGMELPKQDFWLFDRKQVVLMHYGEDGTQLGRELLEGIDPAEYVRWRDLTLANSVPFEEYSKA